MLGVTGHARLNRVGSPACRSGIGAASHKRQMLPLRVQTQGQLKPGTDSTKKEKIVLKSIYNKPINVRHAVPALLGGTAFAAPFVFPAPVFAEQLSQVTNTVVATTPQFSHAYHMVDDHTMCMGCMTIGATFAIFTLGFTGRFIMSL
jgi:hypothetical protein